MEPEEKVAQLNEQIELSCRPPEGYPRPQVLWLRNGVQIEPNRIADRQSDRLDRLDASESHSVSRFSSNGSMTNRKREHKKRIVSRSIRRLTNGKKLKSWTNLLSSDDWQSRDESKKLELMLNDIPPDPFSRTNNFSHPHAYNRNETFDSIEKSKENFKGRYANKSRNSEDDQQLIRIDERLFSKSYSDHKTNLFNSDHNDDRWSSSAAVVITPEHSLRINSFRKEDAGNYTCVAFNASGRRHSRTIVLKGI